MLAGSHERAVDSAPWRAKGELKIVLRGPYIVRKVLEMRIHVAMGVVTAKDSTDQSHEMDVLVFLYHLFCINVRFG